VPAKPPEPGAQLLAPDDLRQATGARPSSTRDFSHKRTISTPELPEWGMDLLSPLLVSVIREAVSADQGAKSLSMTGSGYGVAKADGVNATSGPSAVKPIWVSNAALTIALMVLISIVPQDGPFVLHFAWPDFLFWAVLVATVNLLSIRVQELSFTLDAPVVLAVALLYDPLFAALVALVATVDSRELRLRVNLSYAVFNRLQTSITAFLATRRFT
jgi:hypothetical protein